MAQQRVTDTKDPRWGQIVTDTKDPNWGLPVTDVKPPAPPAPPPTGKSHGWFIDMLWNTPGAIGDKVIEAGKLGLGLAQSAATDPRSFQSGGILTSVMDPIISGMANNSLRHLDQANEAGMRGDTFRFFGHAGAAVPIVGPVVESGYRAMQQGKPENIVADAVIALAGPAAEKWMPKFAANIGPVFRKNMPAEDIAALELMKQKGIPVSLGTATGNRALTGIEQNNAKTSLGASDVAETVARKQNAGLATLSEQLAAKSNNGRGTDTFASTGSKIESFFTKKIDALSKSADNASDKLREMEQNSQVIGVDAAKVRSQVAPIHQRLTEVHEGTAGLNPSSEIGMAKVLLDRVMSSKSSVMRLTDAEDALGAIKGALRNQSNQYGATAGQLKFIIKSLQNEIDDAAKASAPGVFDLLSTRRSATNQKYNVISVLDKFAGTDRLRSNITATENLISDAGSKHLQRVAVQAPEMIPQIARSWWEEGFKKAKEANGFDLSYARREWRAMDDSTKRLLFKEAIAKDPQYLQNVDRFFRGAEMLQMDLNRTGSGAAAVIGGKVAAVPMATAAGMVTGGPIGAATAAATAAGTLIAAETVQTMIMSKMTDPAFVRKLTEGFQIPVSDAAKAAAWSVSIASMLKPTISVKDQNGKPWYFKTQELADAAKKAAGIR